MSDLEIRQQLVAVQGAAAALRQQLHIATAQADVFDALVQQLRDSLPAATEAEEQALARVFPTGGRRHFMEGLPSGESQEGNQEVSRDRPVQDGGPQQQSQGRRRRTPG